MNFLWWESEHVCVALMLISTLVLEITQKRWVKKLTANIWRPTSSILGQIETSEKLNGRTPPKCTVLCGQQVRLAVSICRQRETNSEILSQKINCEVIGQKNCAHVLGHFPWMPGCLKKQSNRECVPVSIGDKRKPEVKAFHLGRTCQASGFWVVFFVFFLFVCFGFFFCNYGCRDFWAKISRLASFCHDPESVLPCNWNFNVLCFACTLCTHRERTGNTLHAWKQTRAQIALNCHRNLAAITRPSALYWPRLHSLPSEKKFCVGKEAEPFQIPESPAINIQLSGSFLGHS